MKIAFIINGFPVVSETFILNQITGLLDLGHNVDIYAQIKINNPNTHSDINKYGLMNNAKYFGRNSSLLEHVFKFIVDFLKNIFLQPRSIIKSLNFLKYKKDSYSFRLFNLACLMKKANYDIIFCHYGPNGELATKLKDIGVVKKVVTFFHGYDLTQLLKKNPNLYSFLPILGDAFVTNCNYFKEKLINLGCDASKISIHKFGFDLNKFKIPERPKNNSNKIQILTVGRLIEKKGHEYALKALAKILEGKENVEYIIVGDGPNRSYLLNITEELGISNFVKFLGSLPIDNIIEIYKDSDIFLLPSITSNTGDQEGTPNVLIEAQLMGLPVISTNYSGIPEIVLNGKTGFLVEEKDINALSNKLDSLISDIDLRLKMGKEARKFTESNFDIKNSIPDIENTFKKLLI